MAFRISQRVICVKRGEWQGQFGPSRDLVAWPVYGETYTIRDIVDEIDGVGLRFEGIVNPMRCHVERISEPTFCATRFRPVRTTSLDCFTKLLAPAPKRKAKERA